MHDIIQLPQQLMRTVSYCPRITAEGAEAQRGSRTGLDPSPVYTQDPWCHSSSRWTVAVVSPLSWPSWCSLLSIFCGSHGLQEKVLIYLGVQGPFIT